MTGAATCVPSGWASATIADTGRYINGLAFEPSDWVDEGLPIIRIQNLTDRTKAFNRTSRLVEDDFIVKHHDILVSWSATLDVFRWDREDAVLNQHIFKVRPEEQLVTPTFLFYLLRHTIVELRGSAGVHGSTMSHINRGPFLAQPVLIPPLPEQHRIVAEIEKQFTRLDAAVAGLARVRANLKRYRAATLAAACEGRLVPTEAQLARAESRGYESGQILLEKAAAPVLPSPVALAEGWALARLDSVAVIQGGITVGQRRSANQRVRPVPYLRVANVQRGWLDLREVKLIDATEAEIRQLRLSSGDVLFNEGGDRDKLGRGWVWRGEIQECIHQNHVFRARIRGGVLEPKLLSWYANSAGQVYFQAEGKQTTNLASINRTKLAALPVPVPPMPEQARIVAEVERRLSLVDNLEAVIEAAEKRAAALRQSILKRAFEGMLVAQDPGDEPAIVLLERIRAERAAAAPNGRPRRPTRRKARA